MGQFNADLSVQKFKIEFSSVELNVVNRANWMIFNSNFHRSIFCCMGSRSCCSNGHECGMIAGSIPDCTFVCIPNSRCPIGTRSPLALVETKSFWL